MSQPLPDPNRHITDNDKNGTSHFSSALPTAVPVLRDLGGALQRLGYVAAPGPVQMSDQADIKAYESSLKNPPHLVPSGGNAAIWYIDTPPDSASPMHRTVSLDIVIQVQGEIELILESGETRLIRPGDITIQRSTLHKWQNRSKTDWSRMVGIMTECQPFQVGGNTLEQHFAT